MMAKYLIVSPDQRQVLARADTWPAAVSKARGWAAECGGWAVIATPNRARGSDQVATVESPSACGLTWDAMNAGDVTTGVHRSP